MWRTAVRLGAVLACAIGLSVIGAPPALAAPYSVNLGLPSGFRAGGSPGAVAVKITRGEKGCVTARWAVTVDLAGMAADQIRVERALAGAWHDIAVRSAGDGVVAFGSEGPLCKGRAIAARYRVSFLAGAPAGRASFVVRASADGRHIGSDSGTRKVIAAKGASPSATPSPDPSDGPTPTADPTEEPALIVPPTQAATAGGGDSGGVLSGVTLIFMIFGVLMIGTGGVLLYLIVRKTRGESADEFSPPPHGDATPTVVLPRIPYE